MINISEIKSKDIVRQTIDFKRPPRLAFDYYAYGRRYTDIVTAYLDWDYEYKRKSWIEGNKVFSLDPFGNTWVRTTTDKVTKGVIQCGVLEDSWEKFDSFTMPTLSQAAYGGSVQRFFDSYPNMFKVGCIYEASFSILCKLRGFSNLMVDLILESGRVKQACEIIETELLEAVRGYALSGADGIHIMEDWGTQASSFISRDMWDQFFAPGYLKICEKAHSYNMKVILHSCGMIDDLIEGLIECGIDVLQFDQTANYSSGDKNDGIERLAAAYGGRVTFFSPVDIQHTLVTGDFQKIDDECRRLVQKLGSLKGGFIAKSYGRGAKMYLDAIGCDSVWNDFAFECFKKYGKELYGLDFDIPELI